MFLFNVLSLAIFKQTEVRRQPPNSYIMLNCENYERNNFLFSVCLLAPYHQNAFLNAGWKKLLSDLALLFFFLSTKGSWKKRLDRSHTWRSELGHLFHFTSNTEADTIYKLPPYLNILLLVALRWRVLNSLCWMVSDFRTWGILCHPKFGCCFFVVVFFLDIFIVWSLALSKSCRNKSKLSQLWLSAFCFLLRRLLVEDQPPTWELMCTQMVQTPFCLKQNLTHK